MVGVDSEAVWVCGWTGRVDALAAVDGVGAEGRGGLDGCCGGDWSGMGGSVVAAAAVDGVGADGRSVGELTPFVPRPSSPIPGCASLDR